MIRSFLNFDDFFVIEWNTRAGKCSIEVGDEKEARTRFAEIKSKHEAKLYHAQYGIKEEIA